MSKPLKILAFATQGTGGNDEARLRTLLSRFSPEFFPFDRHNKRAAFNALRRVIPAYDLVVMEGTGIAGGFALLTSGKPYIFSSGDAIGPFVASKRPLLGGSFERYERALCRKSRGFIGWTPYLAGRALTFGAPRALTAAGWSFFDQPGKSLRQALGIAPDVLVVGIAGSLDWNARVDYCYGHELCRALEKVTRPDVVALVVGGGSGVPRLKSSRVILTGPVPRETIPDYLATMDLASLPQSCDRLGSFRYTTKLPEYLAARLPVVTGQLPVAYDLDSGWLWRLPGTAPWDSKYVDALANLLNTLTREELAAKSAAVPASLCQFDRESQIQRVTALIHDVLSEL